jgi:hypothetical protein
MRVQGDRDRRQQRPCRTFPCAAQRNRPEDTPQQNPWRRAHGLREVPHWGGTPDIHSLGGRQRTPDIHSLECEWAGGRHGTPDIHSLEWVPEKPRERGSHRFASRDCWMPRGRCHAQQILPRAVSNRVRSGASPALARIPLGTVRDARRCFVACRAGETERRLPALNPIEYASTAATKARERAAYLQKRDLRGRPALKPAS